MLHKGWPRAEKWHAKRGVVAMQGGSGGGGGGGGVHVVYLGLGLDGATMVSGAGELGRRRGPCKTQDMFGWRILELKSMSRPARDGWIGRTEDRGCVCLCRVQTAAEEVAKQRAKPS